MENMIFHAQDENATAQCASKLANAIKRFWAQGRGGALMTLEGVLGAGKTTFTRAVLLAMGYSGRVKSPTYTLVEPYLLDGHTVYHFDLYRLSDPEELEYMGIRDYFSGDDLCVVEWPSRGDGVLPAADLTVTLCPGAQLSERKITLASVSEKGSAILGLMQTDDVESE